VSQQNKALKKWKWFSGKWYCESLLMHSDLMLELKTSKKR